MIQVRENNTIVLKNISYSNGEVRSVININRSSIALCLDSGI